MEQAPFENSAVATPPVWPSPAVAMGEAGDIIRKCFSKLESIEPQRAVLVVPDGTLYLTYRALRMFYDAGVAVDLLCPAGHPLAHSRYVRHVCEVTDWKAAEAKVAAFLCSPLRPWKCILVVHEPSVRRLITTLDASSLKIWQPGALLPGIREFYQGKFGLLEAQTRWNLPIPPSRICHNVREVCDFAVELGEPFVVKPSEEMGGAGIRKFNDATAVSAAGQSLKFPLLAQKYIAGQRVVLEVFCARGLLLGWLASYSTAQANGPFTYSTARLFRAMPALQPLAELIARQTQFEGFGGVDCVEEAGTGRIYVMEFNPRHSSGWRFAKACGVDFSPAISAWLEDTTNFDPIGLASGREVPVHYFPTDLARCLRKGDWRGLKNWLPGAKSRHDICWDDPMPFLVERLGWLVKKLRPKAAQAPTGR